MSPERHETPSLSLPAMGSSSVTQSANSVTDELLSVQKAGRSAPSHRVRWACLRSDRHYHGRGGFLGPRETFERRPGITMLRSIRAHRLAKDRPQLNARTDLYVTRSPL